MPLCVYAQFRNIILVGRRLPSLQQLLLIFEHQADVRISVLSPRGQTVGPEYPLGPLGAQAALASGPQLLSQSLYHLCLRLCLVHSCSQLWPVWSTVHFSSTLPQPLLLLLLGDDLTSYFTEKNEVIC